MAIRLRIKEVARKSRARPQSAPAGRTRRHPAPHRRLCPPDAFQRERQAAREPRAGGRGDQPQPQSARPRARYSGAGPGAGVARVRGTPLEEAATLRPGPLPLRERSRHPGQRGHPSPSDHQHRKRRHGPRADLDICYLPASTRFCDLQTLPPSPTPERPAATPAPASQRAKDFPCREEIMARVIQVGQKPSETGSPPIITPARSSRALLIGSILEDKEA